MTKITIYDTEAERIEKIADANDTCAAEIIEMLMDYADDMIRGNGLVEGK